MRFSRGELFAFLGVLVPMLVRLAFFIKRNDAPIEVFEVNRLALHALRGMLFASMISMLASTVFALHRLLLRKMRPLLTMAMLCCAAIFFAWSVPLAIGVVF